MKKQHTSPELLVTMRTISTTDVIVHTRTAETTSSLSLIHVFQIDFLIFAAFLTASSFSSAIATVW